MKKYIITTILILILITLIAGGYMWWKKKDISIDKLTVNSGDEFVLKVNQGAVINGSSEKVYIKFIKIIKDDRCPPFIYCEVGGDAIAKVSVEVAETNNIYYSQSQFVYISDYRGVMEMSDSGLVYQNTDKKFNKLPNPLSNWSAKIIKVDPEPSENRGKVFPQSKYNITLKLTEKE